VDIAITRVARCLLLRPRMKSLLLLPVLLLLATPERAEASGCWKGPYTTTADPHLGCEVVVYEPMDIPLDTTKLTAYRDNQQVNLTGTTTTTTTTLAVFYGNYDCDGTVHQEYTQDETYKVHRIAIADAQVGDQVWLDTFFVGTVQAQGTCTESMVPQPSCTSTNSGYPCLADDAGLYGDDAGLVDDHDKPKGGGCNTTGASSGLALALLALVRRRSRRPR
jgi:uncharacterized protein (TIGR03382 family)